MATEQEQKQPTNSEIKDQLDRLQTVLDQQSNANHQIVWLVPLQCGFTLVVAGSAFWWASLWTLTATVIGLAMMIYSVWKIQSIRKEWRERNISKTNAVILTSNITVVKTALIVFAIVCFALLVAAAIAYHNIATITKVSFLLQGIAGLTALCVSVIKIDTKQSNLFFLYFMAIEFYLAGLAFGLYALANP